MMALVAGLILNATSVAAADGEVVAEFKPQLDLLSDEQFGPSVVDAQGRRLVAINRTVLPWVIPSARIVRILGDGARDSSFPVAHVDNHVHAMVVDDGDAVTVGGNFLKLGDEPAGGVIRLRANGSLDPSFKPAAPLGLRYVSTLAKDVQGGLLVGGWFNEWDGRPVREMVRLNFDGSLDVAFATNSPAADPSSRTSVGRIEVRSDGRIVVRGAGLMVLKSDGRLEWSLPESAAVTAWCGLPDGGWVVAETVLQEGNPRRVRLRRLTVEGTEVVAWRREHMTDGFVAHLLPIEGGGFWARGAFGMLAGQRHHGLVRLLEDGSVDAGFHARLVPTSAGSWEGWEMPGGVSGMRLLGDGRLEVEVSYVADDGADVWRTVQFDAGPRADAAPTIEPGIPRLSVKEGESVRLGFGMESTLTYTVTWTRSGSPVARAATPVLEFREVRLSDAGEYRLVVSNALGVATSEPVHLAVEWGGTAPGSIDRSFQARAVGEENSPAPYQVRSIHSVGNSLYVLADARWAVDAGAMTAVAHESPQVTRLLPDGSADPGFVMLRGASEAARLGRVLQLLTLRDGRLLAELEMNPAAPGTLAERRLVRIGHDGSLDPSFQAELTRGRSFSRVTALLEAPDGKLLVGGDFTGSDGEAWAVVRLRADGSRDTSFKPVPWTGTTRAFALQSDGRILMEIRETGIRRFHPEGTPDESFRPDPAWSAAAAHLMAVDTEDRVLAAIALGSPDTNHPERLVRLQPDGELDPNFAAFERLAGEMSVGIDRVVLRTDGRLLLDLSGIMEGTPSVVLLHADGTVDGSFQLAQEVGGATDLHQTEDGAVFVGGKAFSSATGVTIQLHRLNTTDERRMELARRPDGRVEGRVFTRVGRRYQVEKAGTISGSPWAPLVEWEGDGRERTFIDGAAGQAFYRVRLTAP